MSMIAHLDDPTNLAHPVMPAAHTAPAITQAERNDLLGIARAVGVVAEASR